MRARIVPVVVGIIVVLSGIAAQAHHSWNTVFSEDKPLVLRGTISKVELVNPHAWIWIDVKGADNFAVFTQYISLLGNADWFAYGMGLALASVALAGRERASRIVRVVSDHAEVVRPLGLHAEEQGAVIGGGEVYRCGHAVRRVEVELDAG